MYSVPTQLCFEGNPFLKVLKTLRINGLSGNYDYGYGNESNLLSNWVCTHEFKLQYMWLFC